MRKKTKSVDYYVEGVLTGDRSILAQTITLIESNAEKHFELAQAVLNNVLPNTGKAIRIGITGVPGAGKSTFIDAFGSMLCDRDHRVAVLAVDPSSTLSHGSIMGDKTRMERLSRKPNCYIRPSPSGGTLGGVARKTRESMLVCEAAGFDVIIVETVGVGQSESLVSTMVDFFLLLTLTGAGDDLQNIKKGVIEMADAILINKADGENRLAAERMCADFNTALHYLVSEDDVWKTLAYTCSALQEKGIEEIWDLIREFEKQTKASGYFKTHRREQTLNWLYDMISQQIVSRFYQDPRVGSKLPDIEKQVTEGNLSVTSAVEILIRLSAQYGSNKGTE